MYSKNRCIKIIGTIGCAFRILTLSPKPPKKDEAKTCQKLSLACHNVATNMALNIIVLSIIRKMRLVGRE